MKLDEYFMTVPRLSLLAREASFWEGNLILKEDENKVEKLGEK